VGYTVVLEQETDGGYVVSVPALPGCVSQGDSRAEALANIREAIELYVQDCRDSGGTTAALGFVQEVSEGRYAATVSDRHSVLFRISQLPK